MNKNQTLNRWANPTVYLCGHSACTHKPKRLAPGGLHSFISRKSGVLTSRAHNCCGEHE